MTFRAFNLLIMALLNESANNLWRTNLKHPLLELRNEKYGLYLKIAKMVYI